MDVWGKILARSELMSRPEKKGVRDSKNNKTLAPRSKRSGQRTGGERRGIHEICPTVIVFSRNSKGIKNDRPRHKPMGGPIKEEKLEERPGTKNSQIGVRL